MRDLSRYPWSVQVDKYVVASLTVFIMYFCVSINFVGWRNESKIERGVSHDGTTASAAPTMCIKFSKSYGPCQAIHQRDTPFFQRQLLLLL